MRKLVLLVVLALMIFTLSVGVVFAHDDIGLGGTDNAESHGAGRPVGDHLIGDGAVEGDVPGEPGFENGFQNPDSNAFDAIANNPLCPLHDLP